VGALHEEANNCQTRENLKSAPRQTDRLTVGSKINFDFEANTAVIAVRDITDRTLQDITGYRLMQDITSDK
jgi:hypothetical protein